jgi:hypothetical protein
VWTAQPPLLPRPVRRVALPEWGVDMEEADPTPLAELDEFETMVIDSAVSTPRLPGVHVFDKHPAACSTRINP